MQQRKTNQSTSGKQTFAQTESQETAAFNISLTKEQSDRIEEFFSCFGDEFAKKIDFLFIDALDGKTQQKGDDYLFIMLLKKCLDSNLEIYSQLKF